MIQILGLRQHGSSPKKSEVFFERQWRLNTVNEVFNSQTWLEQIPLEERYNLYYTVADCHEISGRKLKEQHVIPFDIDNIVFPNPDDEQDCFKHAEFIVQVSLDSLGLNMNQVASVFSGNGVQFFVGIKDPIIDENYFERNRRNYKVLCNAIDEALQKANLTGKTDTSVFSKGRLMRLPWTKNIKEGKPTRTARVINTEIVNTDFKLESLGPEEQDEQFASPTVVSNLSVDTPEVLKECGFIKWCGENQTKVLEPQWYAMISVLRWLENGSELCHEYSKKHHSYDHYETEQKIEQAGSSGPRTCEHICTLTDICKSCKHFGKVTTPIQIAGEDFIRTANTGFRNVVMNAQGLPVRKGVNRRDIEKYFVKKYNYFSSEENHIIHVFDGKIYREKNIEAIGAELRKIIHPEASNGEITDLKEHLRESQMMSRDDIDKSIEGKICFQNGVLDFETGAFFEHDKKFYFKNILPYNYNPNAKAPKVEKFLSEVILDKECLEFMKQFVGYAISGDKMWAHVAPMLHGYGRNGKSTFIKLISELIGDENISATPIEDLSKDTGRAAIHDKLLNIAEESELRSLERTGAFKGLISGDKIQCRRLYEKSFTVANKCKIIMTCNEFPSSSDLSTGLSRRIALIGFDATFNDNSEDKFLLEKMMEELPGAFNIFRDAYVSVKKSGKFVIPDSSKERFKEEVSESNNIAGFAMEFLDFGCEEFVKRSDIYPEYRQYCERDGSSKYTASLQSFWKKLKTMRPDILSKKIEGSIHVNVKLKKKVSTIC